MLVHVYVPSERVNRFLVSGDEVWLNILGEICQIHSCLRFLCRPAISGYSVIIINDTKCKYTFNFAGINSACKAGKFVQVGLVRKLRGTIVNIVLPPRVLFHCREIYFTAATFILLPRVLFYCREFYFTAASFILAPRVLFYCREFYYTAASFILPPRVLFSPPRVLFYCKWWK